MKKGYTKELKNKIKNLSNTDILRLSCVMRDFYILDTKEKILKAFETQFIIWNIFIYIQI